MSRETIIIHETRDFQKVPPPKKRERSLGRSDLGDAELYVAHLMKGLGTRTIPQLWERVKSADRQRFSGGQADFARVMEGLLRKGIVANGESNEFKTWKFVGHNFDLPEPSEMEPPAPSSSPPPPPVSRATAWLAQRQVAESMADSFTMDALDDAGEAGLTVPEIIKKAVQAGKDAMATEDEVGASLGRHFRYGNAKMRKGANRGGHGVWVAVGERPEEKVAPPPPDPGAALLWLEKPVDRFTLAAIDDIYMEINGRQVRYAEWFLADQFSKELKDRMVGLDGAMPARRVGIKGTKTLREILSLANKPPAHIFVQGRNDKWFGPFTESWVRRHVEYHRAVLERASKRKGDPIERPLRELLQMLKEENGI